MNWFENMILTFESNILPKNKPNNFKYIRNDGKVSCYCDGVLTHREEESIPRNGCYFIGCSICYYKDNKLHRENDLPAVENSNGVLEWYFNGQRHREKGPAYVRTEGSGIKAWFLYDVEYTEEEFNIYLTKKKLKQALGNNLKEKDTHTKGKI